MSTALTARRLVDLPVVGLCLLGVLGIAAAVTGYALGAAEAPGRMIALPATVAATFAPLGIFVLRRLPGHAIGRLMTFSGVTAGVATIALCWSVWLPAAWLSQWMWWPPLAAIPVLLLLVPDGGLPSLRWRSLAALLVAAAVVTTLALAAAAVDDPRTLLTGGPHPTTTEVRALVAVAFIGLGVVLAGTLGVLTSLVLRWRDAEPLVRRQLACLAPSAVALAVGLAVDAAFSVPVAWLIAVAALPLGLTLAVLQYQLHDLDLHIHRGAVWLVLTASAVAVYAGSVAALGAVFADLTAPTASVLAAAVVAALLEPAQQVAHRGVGRLLYGRRDDPYSVLAELGGHLRGVRDPLAVLPEIAASIVTGLKVPYAAVRVLGDDGLTTAAERGRWSGEPQRFAMVALDRPVGELLVAPRSPGTGFTAAESRLLNDLAGQTALAADALRNAVALQRARDRLVLAREEERRRLRRDLHDGVASALVGTRMLTDAVRRIVGDEGAAPTLLSALAADLDAATAEVRALIDGLRPAALDHGLQPALVAFAERAGGHGMPVNLTIDGSLAGLPAAVEVAAYRIVAEAVTNVTRHAGAQGCAVMLRRDERHMELIVSDDGHGFTRDTPGVGVASIRERAEEIGGQLDLVTGPEGTRLAVLLPLG